MLLVAKNANAQTHSKMYLLGSAAMIAVNLVMIEMIGKCGPAHLGDPENGYALALFKIVIWPWALTCLLIAAYRYLSKRNGKTDQRQVIQFHNTAVMTGAWAEIRVDIKQGKKS